MNLDRFSQSQTASIMQHAYRLSKGTRYKLFNCIGSEPEEVIAEAIKLYAYPSGFQVHCRCGEMATHYDEQGEQYYCKDCLQERYSDLVREV